MAKAKGRNTQARDWRAKHLRAMRKAKKAVANSRARVARSAAARKRRLGT